jgi:HD superfamily phosphohydrolase
VYFHHAKIVAGAMLGRAVQEAQKAERIDEPTMWEMTDDLLVDRLRKSKSEIASRLATEVSLRRLYKEEHAFCWEDLEKPQAHSHLTDQYGKAQGRVGEPDARRDFENEIADIIARSRETY